MKRLILVAFAGIITLGASSCSKMRTCSCANGQAYVMEAAKKSLQKKYCDDYGIASGTSCTVK